MKQYALVSSYSSNTEYTVSWTQIFQWMQAIPNESRYCIFISALPGYVVYQFRTKALETDFHLMAPPRYWQ